MTGIVAKVIADKGFGFIRGEDKKEYFFHKSDFSGFFDDLAQDFDGGRVVTVTFDTVASHKGLRAANVERVDGGV